ncbi:hypothetical protein P43SY_007401 [Pythium insidiosum]|uniref:M96 mating-specific protein family n=1 Tax=Pythium insidiosum TaxID=114742 RepID=A0AAD5Q9H9_PYTIN|nr:hypothetical protein P43SY_007401 [Pythium insidiosum]
MAGMQQLLSDVSALERFLEAPWGHDAGESPIDALLADQAALFPDLEPALPSVSPAPSSSHSVASSEEFYPDFQRDDVLMSMLVGSDDDADDDVDDAKSPARAASAKRSAVQETTRDGAVSRRRGAAARASASASKTSSKKLSSRQRQREEILVLRESVKEMEAELRRLRLGRNRVVTSDALSRDAAVTSLTASVNAFWEAVAKRESGARSRAMEENMRLQQQLRRHFKLTKALQKVLQQRLMLEHEDRALSQARIVHQLGLDDMDSSRIYSSLLGDIDLKYFQTDDILVQSGLAGTTRCYATKVQGLTYREGDGDWCLESAESQVIPFDKTHVQNTTWKNMGTSMDDSIAVYRVDYHDHNLIRARFCAKAKVGASNYEIKGYLASRRYVENDRSVFVWGVWNHSF